MIGRVRKDLQKFKNGERGSVVGVGSSALLSGVGTFFVWEMLLAVVGVYGYDIAIAAVAFFVSVLDFSYRMRLYRKNDRLETMAEIHGWGE